MNKLEIKKAYKVEFNRVKNIVNNNDPIGLVSGGAPDDEYDIEIGKIMLIKDRSDIKQFTNEVEKIFVEYFGENSIVDHGAFERIARDVLSHK